MASILLAVALVAASGERGAGDWSSSPEAYFMTAAETQEWKKLTSEEERARFQLDYWRRRDPTPDTDRHVFQERVRSRILSADDRFSFGKTAGSRSRRGASSRPRRSR